MKYENLTEINALIKQIKSDEKEFEQLNAGQLKIIITANSKPVSNISQGQLNPRFVMEMMGFPADWTELPFLNGEMKA